MPQFEPGEAKTAVAPITVQPAGLSCTAEIFLGPDEATKVATSGLVPFTSVGVSQDVRLPLNMPSAEGSYHVYIDVYAEGMLIAAYQALEDVVITTVGAPEDFQYTNISCSAPQKPDSAWHYLKFDAVITNVSNIPQTREVRLWEYDQGRGKWWNVTLSSGLKYVIVSLDPGQSYQFHHSDSTVARNCTIRMYLIDDVGGQSSTCRCSS